MGTFEQSIQEMRSNERFEVSEVIHVSDRQSGEQLGQLVNISEEGLMLLSTKPVTEDNIFQLSLEYSDESGNTSKIQVGVESLWCHASADQTQFWSGFYIIDISDEALERIRELTK